MRRLGSFVLRRRWWVLIGGLLLAGLGGAYGTGASERLSAGGFNEPGAESSRAARALQDDFRTGPPNVILLVTAQHGKVTDPDVVAAGLRLNHELGEQPSVVESYSFWSLAQVPQLRNEAATRAMVLGFIPGDEDAVKKGIEGLADHFTRRSGPVTVGVG